MQAFRRQSARIKLSPETPGPLEPEASQMLEVDVPAETLRPDSTKLVSSGTVATTATTATEPLGSSLGLVTEPDCSATAASNEKKLVGAKNEKEALLRGRAEKLADELSKDKYELWHWALGSGLIIVLLYTPSWALNLAICSAIVTACYFAYKQPQAFFSSCFRLFPIVFSWATLIKLAIAYCAQLVLTNLVYSIPHLILWLPDDRPLINTQFLWQKIAIMTACVGSTILAYKHFANRLGASTRLNLNYSIVLLVSAGICCLLSGMPFTTFGIADLINNWLCSSVNDANIPMFSDVNQAWAPFKILVALLLYYAFSKPITFVALNLALEVEGRKYKRYAKSALQTASQSVNCTNLDLTIRAAHPAIKYCFQTALWLAFCYGSLFLLFSHGPGALGQAIDQFLTESFETAYEQIGVFISIDLYDEPKFRDFLASFVALCATAPLAVMSTAFLPPTKSGQLQIRPWGLYRKRFSASLPFTKPIHLWQDLKSVNITGKVDSRCKGTVVLKFSDGEIYKFAPRQVDLHEMQILLETIDECAPNCKIEPAVLLYLSNLQTKEKASNKEEQSPERLTQRKFNATAFTPYNPGQIVDNSLRIVRMLGSKPLSAVYLVRTNEGKLAILKQFSIAAPALSLEKLLTDFERECKLLESLNDKGISKVYKTFRTEDSQFLLLEYKVGKDLFHLINEGETLSENSVCQIAKDIAKLMLTLHNHVPAIIHRDLTPDNIVLTPEGTIAIIDFGSAHQFAEGITGTLVGKQAYIAPEQLRGKATMQSDIYSFGSCLNYFLSGKEPKALSQSDPHKGGIAISDKLNDLIKRCTEYDAEQRPASFEEILSYLEKLEDDS